MKLIVFAYAAVTVLSLYAGPVQADEKQEDAMVEETTESPIADMTLVDTKSDVAKPDDAVKAGSAIRKEMETIQHVPATPQHHTISDYIIQPLIAIRPRAPEIESVKQADTSSTTSPWTLGSLAGIVTGWLGNRIQLPGFVDTPVHESTTTSTTTTTIRPDVVVQVNQRVPTKRPFISLDNNNDRPHRRNQRPNFFNGNYVDDSEENDDLDGFDSDEDFNIKRGNRRRHQYDAADDEYDDDDDEEEEVTTNADDEEEGGDEQEEIDDYNNGEDDEESEENVEKPVKQQNNHRRRPKPMNFNQSKRNQQRKQQLTEADSTEDGQYDDGEDDGEFDYSENEGPKPSTNMLNLIQRGPQNLLKQIRDLNREQAFGNSLRKSQRPQLSTLLISRNGQTFYLAPELLEVGDVTSNKANVPKKQLVSSQTFPQPPLTVPYKRQGQPTQYITIPWSQLGISTPGQIVSLAEGVQSQPLILSIPQSSIENMQNPKLNKRKPSITANAVPLLAEASIMDIFKPPHIPPARTPSIAKPTKAATESGTAVIIAKKTKPATTRIRSSTIVEKAPPIEGKTNDQKSTNENDSKPLQLFVIGDEMGDRKLSRSAYKRIVNYLNQNRRERQVAGDDEAASEFKDHFIPVQIISDEAESKMEPSNSSDNLGVVKKSPSIMDSLKREPIKMKVLHRW